MKTSFSKKPFLCAAALALGILGHTLAQGQPATGGWTNRYNGPGNSADIAAAMATDGSGNVIVTGYSTGSGSDYDYTTIKYSSAGVPLWTNLFNGPANSRDRPYAVAVDRSGNVIVTGISTASGSDLDYATIKYSSASVAWLTIARTTTNTLALSWPSATTNFTLQQNTNVIASSNWSNVVATPADDGTTKTVILTPPAANAFYRLIHQ